MNRIIKPDNEFIESIASTMRCSDTREVMLSHGHNPYEALQYSCNISDYIAGVEIDGVPVSLFGLCMPNVLSKTGVPWLLSSNRVLKNKRQLLLVAPGVISDMFNVCDRLVNYVHCDNMVSIRWLKYLGFTMEEAKPYGVCGKPFHKFSMRKGHV